ncbi:hypothetical protein Tco_0565431 [Tanacetum coccineum]
MKTSPLQCCSPSHEDERGSIKVGKQGDETRDFFQIQRVGELILNREKFSNERELRPTKSYQDQEGSEKVSDEVSTAGLKKGPVSEEVPTVSTAEATLSTAGGTVTYSRRKHMERGTQELKLSRDEEVLDMGMKKKGKELLDAAKSTKKIDWNDPFRSLDTFH